METLTMTPDEEMTANYTAMNNETITAKDSPSPRTTEYWSFDGVILGA